MTFSRMQNFREAAACILPLHTPGFDRRMRKKRKTKPLSAARWPLVETETSVALLLRARPALHCFKYYCHCCVCHPRRCAADWTSTLITHKHSSKEKKEHHGEPKKRRKTWCAKPNSPLHLLPAWHVSSCCGKYTPGHPTIVLQHELQRWSPINVSMKKKSRS